MFSYVAYSCLILPAVTLPLPFVAVCYLFVQLSYPVPHVYDDAIGAIGSIWIPFGSSGNLSWKTSLTLAIAISIFDFAHVNWTFLRLTLAKSLPRSNILVPPQQQKFCIQSRHVETAHYTARVVAYKTRFIHGPFAQLSYIHIYMFRLTWLHCKTPPVYGRFRFLTCSCPRQVLPQALWILGSRQVCLWICLLFNFLIFFGSLFHLFRKGHDKQAAWWESSENCTVLFW